METTRLKRIVIHEDGIVGALYRPEPPGPYPAVIVLGGSEGGVPERAAAKLAGEGFAAMALAYFGIDPLPRYLVEIPLEYVASAIAWLKQPGEVDANRLAVLGRSRGGELALLLASTYPESLRAVVAYVASGIAWQAPPSDPRAFRNAITSSWSLGGEPVPFLAMARPTRAETTHLLDFLHGKPVALRPFFERALQQQAAASRATIAVEKINGPVMLLSGGSDQLWPSRDLAEMVMKRLEIHRHPFPYRHLCYDEAGHLIGIPETIDRSHRLTPGRPLMGGSPEADEAASRSSWPLVVAFLHAALGVSTSDAGDGERRCR